jgi:hypothetical protein
LLRLRYWLTAFCIAGAVAASSAGATAYVNNVYSPEDHGDYIRGWGNVTRDCSNTYGCWIYIKLERWSSLLHSWRYVSGRWQNSSGSYWASKSAYKLSDCRYYRTTVDAYNDSTAPIGGGANIGPVGAASNGQQISRYKTVWSSGYVRLCHP